MDLDECTCTVVYDVFQLGVYAVAKLGIIERVSPMAIDGH